MTMNGLAHTDSVEDEALLAGIAGRYDSCHPDDSFADLVRRSSFSKEDRRLMQDRLDAARRWPRSGTL